MINNGARHRNRSDFVDCRRERRGDHFVSRNRPVPAHCESSASVARQPRRFHSREQGGIGGKVRSLTLVATYVHRMMCADLLRKHCYVFVRFPIEFVRTFDLAG